jgi:hypothetical protein
MKSLRIDGVSRITAWKGDISGADPLGGGPNEFADKAWRCISMMGAGALVCCAVAAGDISRSVTMTRPRGVPTWTSSRAMILVAA